MQYEDKMTIATPEGVALEVTLAGVASRFAAALVDGLIQGVLLFALAQSVDIFDGDGSDTEAALIWVALATALSFVVLFFYYIFFETLWSGRSPGKRAL